MKRSIFLFFILFTLFAGATTHAEAQFFKKLFQKKEQKTKKKPPVRKPSVKQKPEPPKPVKKKREINYPVSEKKARYRVDILAPLYLDELVKDGKSVYKGKLPEKVLPGMDFYEGVKIATDTLNAMGYSVDVYIHDIVAIDKTPEKLVANKTLEKSDLIIGLVQSQQIGTLADFAKKHEINFVSALSPSDGGVRNNPFFTLLQPSLQSHCDWIMNKVSKKYKRNRVTMLYRTSVPVDDGAYKYLTAERESDAMTKILCNTMPSKQQLQKLFDSSDVNVIVMAIVDNGYAESLLATLNQHFPNYRFEVFGMPSWKGLRSLSKPDAYPNIAVYITTPSYYDISTTGGQALAAQYKADFGSSRPSDMVFKGYETIYWYTYLLQKHGTVFNDNVNENGTAPFTKFEIKPRWDKDDNLMYTENTQIYMYRYQSSSYIVEQ